MKNKATQKNIPDGWQARKLASIFEFKNGLNKEKEFFGHGTPIINYMDINKGGGLYKDNIFGRVEVNKSELARFNVVRGDVFFTRTSETLDEIGFSAVALDNFQDTVFSGFVLRARPKEELLLPEYAQYCFRAQSARKEIMEKSSYTTRALTSGTLLNHVNINLPPLPEQKRIVAVLETWDKAIEKLAKKIEIKKEVKRGLMQDLLTGKKRPPGFEDKWEIKKLVDICDKEKSDVSANTLDSNRGDYPIYGASGFIKNIDFYKQKKSYISIIKDGAGVGRLTLHKAQTSVLGTLDILHENKNSDLMFLYFLLQIIDFKKYMVGSTIPHIYFKDYKKEKIVIPDIKEQKAIADILTIADKEIHKLEEKLITLQEQKRYLLNNLVTGTIRTPETLSIHK